MRLNQYHKDAFVSAVMDDIPKVDYSEEIRKFVQEYALSKLPPDIRKIWRNNELRGFLNVETRYFCDVGVAFPLWIKSAWDAEREIEKTEEMQEFKKLYNEQKNKLAQAKSKIKAAINSVSSVKKARELFPEFEKYLPKENDPAIKFAPAVIANLSADLMALGWPKDSKKPKSSKVAA